MAFTKEQELAITESGKNIIVSAGAGSGKTAVLTERVIRKLKNGVDVDKLLVLTFTNEAANEMKSRIRDAIIKNKLNDQLDLIDLAYITTFDSYALSLVKKYHYLLNISNNIKIINSEVITIYKYRLLDQIFEEMYGDNNFNNLINDFCLKDDKSIKDFIILVSNKLDLLVNKEKYLDNYFDKMYSEDYLDSLVNDYDKLIRDKIQELRNLYDEVTRYIDSDLIIKLDDWFKPLFDGFNYNDFVLFNSKNTVRFSKMSEEGIKVKVLLIDKAKEIKELLRFKNNEEIKETIKSTKNNVLVIIDIVKKLDKSVLEYKDKYEVYEFNDISHMAIKIVRDNKIVREEIKDYFNEIMIDEYQDTSSLQEEFISYISNNNVYMVGDIKQSIYRFRNANPYIFQDKYNRYSRLDGGIKIDLLKNFRSRQETLYNINEIFNLIMDDEIGNADYINGHNMVYGNTLYDMEDSRHNNYLEVFNYSVKEGENATREEKELFIISEDINDKVKNGYLVFDKKTGKLRKIKYSDICIITDRNKFLPTYKKILEYHNIPSVLYMDQVLTNDTVILVIKNLINLVEYVNTYVFDDKFRYLFTSVARSFLFSYSDNMIYQIYKNNSYLDDKIVKLCKEIDINIPIVTLINDILNKFNVYEKLTNLSDIEKNVVMISNLIDIASSLSDLGYSISDFINYLDDTDKLQLNVKYSVNSLTEDAVKIMNIHKSKGLEFSLCYFTGMHNKFTIKEISSKTLISNKYGIILPYVSDGELNNTILKEMYVNDYYNEEISEKIRLFYVALTRCREKMIILASLDMENDKYDKLVPSFKRIKYRSFLDILNSIKVIDKYIANKDVLVDKKYDKIMMKEITTDKSDIVIDKRKIEIEYKRIENSHFSKENKGIILKEDINKMEYGTKIHEILEYEDFRNSKNKYVLNLLGKVPRDFINIYHEYEFSYDIDNNKYNGIIDLMLEYDKFIYIIDYKLKNISDKEYVGQLSGYKDYIKSISNKEVKTFLYSIMDNELMEVYDEEK